MSIAYSIQEHLQISGIIARPAVYDLLFSPIDEDIGWRFFQTYVYLLKHAEKIQLIFKSPNENKQKYSISKPKIQFSRYISKLKQLFRIPFPNQKYSISMYIQISLFSYYICLVFSFRKQVLVRRCYYFR